MANQLDLQEQEQLDALKVFWRQYGNLITWTLTLALLAYAAWAGWNWYQREQSYKASAMYDELERAAQASDTDKVARVFADLKDRYPRTAYAEQGGLLAAKIQYEKGKVDAAISALDWVADNALEDEYRSLARLRLAGVLLDGRKFDDAIKQLDGATAPTFAALVADRRGDVLAAQGKADGAKAAYGQAYKQLDDKLEYRRLIEAKLVALGAAPGAVAAAASAPPASGAAK
jgi:predicted negative regulator of RcsB-dependent stress response